MPKTKPEEYTDPNQEFLQLIEPLAEKYADEQADQFRSGGLESEQVFRSRVQEEFKQAAKMDELEEYLKCAFTVIRDQGVNYLENKQWETVNQEIEQTIDEILAAEIKEGSEDLFQSIKKMSDQAME